MAKRLEIYLLGGIEIFCDGRPINQLASRKAEALLAYLVCNPRKHAREVLATLLWDDRTQKQTLGNLRVLLNSLRQDLGEFIDITRQTVAFKPESNYWLDVEAFDAQLSQVKNMLSAEERISPKETALLEDAIGHYRGDFLEGFYLRESQGFEEWAILQRERRQRQVLEVLQELASYYLRRREYTAGIEKATRLVKLDPLGEEGHRLLMRLLARNGQRNAALKQYKTCHQILADELGVPPTPETNLLYERLRETHSAKTYHLPLEFSQFVGRQEELAAICERFENPACRLLTLVGPGGIGKTWLAAEFARLTAQERADTCPDGVYFVSLAAISSEFLVPTIAEALDFSFYGRENPQELLINYLCQKEMLLVLDNFEHLIAENEQTGALLAEILRQAPGVLFLITSRQPLNLRTEWLLEIRGLEYPQETVNTPEAWSAVQLFGIAAQRVQPDFSLSQELPEVVRVCQLVEGMPLGIELAAAWLRGYTCAEIADQISKDLNFLSSTLQDLPPRHRSLGATFEHSWQLLGSKEQDVFCRLTIFRGGFSSQAAQAVAGANPAILRALVEKSLLQRDQLGRFSIHELLRQYAEHKLKAAAIIWQETSTRQAEYYATFLQERTESLHDQQQLESMQQIVTEIDNLRAAWDWALDHQITEAIERSMAALHRFYDIRSWFQEGYERFARAVSLLADESPAQHLSLGRALTYQGWFAFRLGKLSEAQEILKSSEQILRVVDDPVTLAIALNGLGHVVKGNRQREQLYRESLTLQRANGSFFGVLSALNSLGIVLRSLGRYREAEEVLEEAMQICQQIGDQWTMSIVLNNQGVTARIQGNYQQAKTYYQESCKIKEAVADRRGHAISLNNLGNVDCELGEYAEAQKLHQQSLDICKELGNQEGIARSYNNLGKLAYIQGDYTKAWDLHQQSLQIKNRINDLWGKAHSLNQLGIVAIELDKIEEAIPFFHQALEIAIEFNSIPLILSILIEVSQSLAQSKQQGEAVMVLACALSHEAIEKSAQKRGRKILEGIKEQIPSDEFETAWEAGKAKTLENLTAQILEAPKDGP